MPGSSSTKVASLDAGTLVGVDVESRAVDVRHPVTGRGADSSKYVPPGIAGETAVVDGKRTLAAVGAE